MESNFTDIKWSADSSGSWLMIKLPFDEIRSITDRVKAGKKYTLNIKQFRKKRSKNANAYFWQMVGQLANKLRITPVEVYHELIRSLGDNFEVVSVRTERVNQFMQIWANNGLGRICDNLGEDENGFCDVITYYGSSTYNSAQMSALIELLLRECEEQGIDCDSDQLRSLLEDKDEQGNKVHSNS